MTAVEVVGITIVVWIILALFAGSTLGSIFRAAAQAAEQDHASEDGGLLAAGRASAA